MIDMRVSGSGRIPAGEYDNISIRGSGRLFGAVRCICFSSSGRVRGESISCGEHMKTSGSVRFTQGVSAKSIRTRGSFSCGGDIAAQGSVRCSGSTKCQGSIKCESIDVCGRLQADGSVEAESLTVNGGIDCNGLLNAERIKIKIGKRMRIRSMGGSSIRVTRRPDLLSAISAVFGGAGVLCNKFPAALFTGIHCPVACMAIRLFHALPIPCHKGNAPPIFVLFRKNPAYSSKKPAKGWKSADLSPSSALIHAPVCNAKHPPRARVMARFF